MKRTGRIAKFASTSDTGLFAPLRGLLPIQGSGAPVRILMIFAAALAALVFTSTAFAAAPEVPSVVTVEAVKASSATFRGVLNPGKAGGPGTYELGTYEYLYKASATECKGGGRAPESLGRGSESSGISLGGGEEALPAQEVTGLEPHTEYTVCLLARNGSHGEEAIGPAAHFTTATPVEAPEGLKVKEPAGATTATLEGALNPHNPGEAGSYEFAYRRSATECQRENAETHQQENENATHNEPSSGGQGEAAKPAGITELLPNVKYTFCLVAHNNAGETAVSSPVTFTTGTEAPSVIDTTLTHLGSAGATVSAQIDTGGLETSYRVQYGTTSRYGLETAPVSIASTQTVSVALAGLEPNTEYYVRFVAVNEAGSGQGTGLTFTAYPPGLGTLSDNRVYEMVMPPGNHDAELYELRSTERLFQAAADGSAVAYVADATTGGNGSSGAGNAGDEYLATRSPGGGWIQANITPAGSENETAYEGFSNELTVGFFENEQEAPFVATTALPELPAAKLNGEPTTRYNVLYSDAFDENLYRPLFTTRPPYREGREGDTKEKIQYGGIFSASFRHPIANQAGPLYAGSSANTEDQLFEANDDLLEGNGELEKELDGIVKKEAEELKEIPKAHTAEEILERWAVGDRNELYESVAGRVSLMNVLPDGKIAPGATFGGQSVGFFASNEISAEAQPDFSNDISADGSRVFWTAFETSIAHEARVNGEQAVELSPGVVYVRENGTKTVQVSLGPAQFWTASRDGKFAFYTEAGKLWRFDVEDQTRVELAGSGGGGVQGVLGTNETGVGGAYVYFVAGEAIPGSGDNAAKQQAVEGADNLYVSESDPESPSGSKIVFIAALSSADNGDWSAALGGRTANVTPDGQALVFGAHENFTAGSYPDEGIEEEMYVYDTHEASLFCASCRAQASGGHLPASDSLTHTYRHISEDGNQVFFDSSAPLVARDVNGAQDVYEWERDGSGGCDEADGCVYLLSGGIEGEAYLIDASVSGNDVFFASRQKLVPADGGDDLVLYDARVDGALPVAPPECTGTGCQGLPAPPPIFATPASVTFGGIGNFPPPAPVAKAKPKSKKAAECKKGFARKKGRCVKAKERAKKSAIKGRKS